MVDLSGESLLFRKRFVLFLLLLITGLFLFMIRGFFEALVMAAVFGALMRPVYLWLQKRLGGRNAVASGLTLLFAILAIVIPGIFLLGLLANEAQTVVTKLSPWVSEQVQLASDAERGLPDWVPFRDLIEPYQATISAKVAEFASNIGQWLIGTLSTATQGTASFFLSLFIMLYAMYYFLISGPATLKRAMDFLPLSPEDRGRILEVGRSVSLATLKGTLVIGIIQGMLGGLSLAIAGFEGAIFWGALMAVMSVIPGIGTFVVWGPIVIWLLIQGDTTTGLALLAWNGIVVSSVDNILRPMLVGKDTQMPDLLILLSTLGGLTLFGMSGLVIGPVVAGLCVTCWAIYGRVFKDWLPRSDGAGNEPAPGEGAGEASGLTPGADQPDSAA